MPKTLIIYASRYGQTARISFLIAHKLRNRGMHVDVFNILQVSNARIENYDAVIIGSPIYLGRSISILKDWAFENRNNLKKKLSAFFTVSLNAADKREAARKADTILIENFKKASQWQPNMTASFAGGLHYPRYNIFLRWLMKAISRAAGGPTDTSQEHDLTDWKMVETFAEDFCNQLVPITVRYATQIPEAFFND